MGIAKLYGQKASGTNINGIIKKYNAIEDIAPGDLVELINETDIRKTTTSQFDGIAKTGGKGATLYIDNILSTIWTEVTKRTEFIAENGIKLTAKDATDNGSAINAFDGNESTFWTDIDDSLTTWLKLEFPRDIKINKLLTYIDASGGTATLSSVKIQGSADDITWTDIYTLTSPQTQLTELILNNSNFYRFYRFYIELLKSNSTYYPRLKEIKMAEYELRDLVSIYTLDYQPTYVDFTSNILPTSWIDTTRQNATASNDYGDWNIKCSNNSTQPDTSMAYAISKMVDNNTGTFFKAGTDSGGATIQIRIALPEKVTINVSSIYINQRYIGSDSAIYGICDDGLVELGKLTATETQIEETLTISNDYYFNTVMLKLSGFGESTANWQPFIFDFKINKGTLRIENN